LGAGVDAGHGAGGTGVFEVWGGLGGMLFEVRGGELGWLDRAPDGGLLRGALGGTLLDPPAGVARDPERGVAVGFREGVPSGGVLVPLCGTSPGRFVDPTINCRPYRKTDPPGEPDRLTRNACLGRDANGRAHRRKFPQPPGSRPSRVSRK
jgi:hypothetical protein